ncbi:GNAT family N-acetyltransferase [Gluconacetobacter tumulisoli]|uniref:GNAT family N-acetyltransferase n=1 Tax=Gluconacetobacter tumulisoli TaxID=1286189 RepID=A0A7W4K9C8_9PROT|nr:GNAT family N-acetyltransferase [Gluconacetobacter tumulisoli]MBB2202737.1 GNAT family N-acetyltransferase [Gluconacetobacter tumulisoli]
MQNIDVRGFQAGDLETVAQLWRSSALSTGLAPESEPSLAEYQDRLARESRCAWSIHVACNGSEIVGFLAFERQRSWLRQLFVSPAMKGAGVGTVLLTVAKREMPAGFRLRTSADNHPARRFYERRGLRMDGQFPHETLGFMTVRYRWP